MPLLEGDILVIVSAVSDMWWEREGQHLSEDVPPGGKRRPLVDSFQICDLNI